MKRIVTLILATLLFSPGIATSAERKTVESQAPTATKGQTQKLDLNRASRDDLVGVPGIGPRTAQAIVDLRAKKGSFTKLEELLEVRGIKEKKLATISAYLVVTPPQQTLPATSANLSQ